MTNSKNRGLRADTNLMTLSFEFLNPILSPLDAERVIDAKKSEKGDKLRYIAVQEGALNMRRGELRIILFVRRISPCSPELYF